MPALAQYGRPVDGTIPLTALLYDDEQLLASQEGVGLYDGPSKSDPHQSGSVHVTSHRLFFVAGAQSSSPVLAPLPEHERGASLTFELKHVSHTESYAGFWKSSPKVTLHLKPLDNDQRRANEDLGRSSNSPPTSTSTPVATNSKTGLTEVLDVTATGAFDVWECEICGYRNPPGLSPAARNACGLCGMPRSVSTSASPMPSSSTVTPQQTGLRPQKSELLSPVPITASSSVLSHARTVSHSYSRSLPSSNINTPAQWSLSSSPAVTATPPSPSSSNPRDDTIGRKKKRFSSIACPACTFLNHPSVEECEICGTVLHTGGAGTQDTIQHHYASKSAPSSRPVSPDTSESVCLDERERYIRLSFRKGGDKSFYAALKTALQQKVWEARETTRWKSTSPVGGSSGLSGISGILQNIDTNAAYTERGMSDAFEDLEALMSKAQDMVRLARDLNEQLTAASRNPSASDVQLEPEEATFVRSSLAQLGLSMKNAPITADMSNDEKKYADQLALELAGVLEGDDGGENIGMMKQKGIIGLDEVWGGWNRARGIALISPELTLKCLPYLPRHTHPPIHTRTLASGLRVLHAPAYSLAAFAGRLVALIVDTGPRTTTQVAGEEGLSVGLVDELVKEVEEAGDICREDPMTGFDGEGLGIEVRWWANAFVGYAWDGQSD